MDFKRISHYDFKLLYDTDSINLVARNYIHCVVSFNCLPKLQEETIMNFQSYHIILDEKQQESNGIELWCHLLNASVRLALDAFTISFILNLRVNSKPEIFYL